MTKQIYHPNTGKGFRSRETVYHNEGYDCGLSTCTEKIKNQEYIAYCNCGDALERKELYPNEATYHCFGCDKTYKLVEQKSV